MDIQLSTRPAQADDEQRLYRLWPRLSRETVYRRFHSPIRGLPAETVHRLVDVDHDRREAVVALVGDEIVGVARYDRSPDDPSTADIAVLVEDAWQGVGLGRQLLSEVAELARRRGVRTVLASVQADNDRMVWLARRLFPDSTMTVDASVYEIRGSLSEPRTPPPRLPALAGSTAHPSGKA